MKNGKFVLYNGKEYGLSKVNFDGTVRIVSYDKKDLKKGFSAEESEAFIRQNGFRCYKYVFKVEISEAYEVKTKAMFRGQLCDILELEGRGNMMFLRCSKPENVSDAEWEKKMKEIGFVLKSIGKNKMPDQYGSDEISIKNSEVSLVEEKTPIPLR